MVSIQKKYKRYQFFVKLTLMVAFQAYFTQRWTHFKTLNKIIKLHFLVKQKYWCIKSKSEEMRVHLISKNQYIFEKSPIWSISTENRLNFFFQKDAKHVQSTPFDVDKSAEKSENIEWKTIHHTKQTQVQRRGISLSNLWIVFLCFSYSMWRPFCLSAQ